MIRRHDRPRRPHPGDVRRDERRGLALADLDALSRGRPASPTSDAADALERDRVEVLGVLSAGEHDAGHRRAPRAPPPARGRRCIGHRLGGSRAVAGLDRPCDGVVPAGRRVAQDAERMRVEGVEHRGSRILDRRAEHRVAARIGDREVELRVAPAERAGVGALAQRQPARREPGEIRGGPPPRRKPRRRASRLRGGSRTPRRRALGPARWSAPSRTRRLPAPRRVTIAPSSWRTRSAARTVRRDTPRFDASVRSARRRSPGSDLTESDRPAQPIGHDLVGRQHAHSARRPGPRTYGMHLGPIGSPHPGTRRAGVLPRSPTTCPCACASATEPRWSSAASPRRTAPFGCCSSSTRAWRQRNDAVAEAVGALRREPRGRPLRQADRASRPSTSSTPPPPHSTRHGRTPSSRSAADRSSTPPRRRASAPRSTRRLPGSRAAVPAPGHPAHRGPDDGRDGLGGLRRRGHHRSRRRAARQASPRPRCARSTPSSTHCSRTRSLPTRRRRPASTRWPRRSRA